MSSYPLNFETRASCSWLGGHPLATPEQAAVYGSRQVRSTGNLGARKTREQDEFLARILRLVDNRTSSCYLGQVELESSQERRASVYLRRKDLLRIAGERPDIRADNFAKLPQIVEKGAVAYDTESTSSGFVGYIPEAQMDGYVVELVIEEDRSSATCADFRRQRIGSIRQSMAKHYQVRSQR